MIYTRSYYRIVKLNIGVITLLMFLFSESSCTSDEGVVPQTDTTDTSSNSTAAEYIQWNNTKVESNDFTNRKFRVESTDSSLVVEFDNSKHQNIPGTELVLAYDYDQLSSDFRFEERKFIPAEYGDERGKIAIRFLGYKSGTGKFWSDETYPYGSCQMFKKNGKWVIEFENVTLKDLADDTRKGQVSGRLIWHI